MAPTLAAANNMAPDLWLAQFTDARPEPFATARAATALAAISGEPAKLTPQTARIAGIPGFRVKFESARWAYPYVAAGPASLRPRPSGIGWSASTIRPRRQIWD